MDASDRQLTLERFFDLSVDVMHVANASGVFELVNPSLCKTLGLSYEEATSTPFVELLHPSDVDSTLEAWEQMRSGTASVSFRNRYRHADGHHVVLEWSARWDHEQGKAYAIGREISDQTLYQNQLSSLKEALFRHTIYAQTDIHGVITKVSDLFCEISGYPREELVGKTHKVVNSGSHAPEFFRDLWATISSGNVWSGLIKNCNKSGEPYFVQSVIFPVAGIDGEIAEYHAIRQDITEIINGRSEHQRILNILNETNAIAKIGGWELEIASGDLNWTDETFEILEVEKVAGQKPVLAEGLQLFTEEYAETMATAVRRGIEFGEPYSLEVQALTAKGNVKWVYTNGRANYRKGKIVSLSGTIQDIDERMKAQIQFHHERQKSIQNAKLASLGELAASIAHEINNPLAIISGNAELLQISGDAHSPEATLAAAKTISRSCERMTQMVRTLRKYSRSDEVASKQTCRLADIVREALLLTSAKAKRELVAVEQELDEDAEVLGNDIQLEQVAINLINNAIDAVADLDERSIHIALFTNAGRCILTVTDSGSGIPAAEATKIFKPFYTTKASGEGTGLGLPIVAEILKDHGATISLDTACDKTRFVITFDEQGTA